MDPFKKKKLDEAIVKMTITMNKPFIDIENQFFRKILFVAEPNYLCPNKTRNTATFVTAQPQPQPNSTSTRVGVDKVISRTTPPPPPPPPVKLLRHFQTT